jgi:hypothetical protein
MRTPSLLAAAKARLQPRHGLAVLTLLAVVSMIRISIGEVPVLQELPHLVVGCFLVLAVIALAPVPWQWSGGGRRLARPWQGLGQALVWNAAWLGLLMLFLAPLQPLPGRDDRNPVRTHVAQVLGQHTLLQRILVPMAGLLRIHRHLLVRPEVILGIKPVWGGRLVVTLPGGVELESSRGATAKIKQRLGLN